MSALLQDAKTLALAWWAAVDAAAPDQLQTACRAHLPESFRWQGPAPYTELHGPDALAAAYLAPLKRAIPDLQRQTHIFMAGVSNGRKDGTGDGAVWVAGTGYMTGTAVSDFLTIPPGPRPLRLRWGEFLRIEAGQIVQSQFLLDFVDWFEQIGRPVLPRPKGVPFVFPAPTGYDGILSAAQDEAISQNTLTFSRDFIYGGLNKFDKSDLSSMGMAKFFHPNLKWYGPGGIGGCLSLKEFEDLHQRPWLIAFPDRQVQDLDNLIAEDRMVGASSFPGVLATHTGPYQDTTATGNKIAFNGIDFWLKTDGQFTENWVFVDMIDLFRQFGIDLFGRMRAHGGTA
jgi:predicted ester cyclase